MSYKKMEGMFPEIEKKPAAINHNLVTTGAVQGGINTSIMCVKKVPCDTSKDVVVQMMEKIGAAVENGITSTMVVTNDVGGDITTDIGSIDFSSFTR